MSVPNWYEALLLGAAAWRCFQLLAFDSILDQPRRYLTRLGKEFEHSAPEGSAKAKIPKEYREKWALFINCPYCLGWWIGLAWWGAWLIWDEGTLIAATPFALSALVIAGHKLLASE